MSQLLSQPHQQVLIYLSLIQTTLDLRPSLFLYLFYFQAKPTVAFVLETLFPTPGPSSHQQQHLQQVSTTKGDSFEGSTGYYATIVVLSVAVPSLVTGFVYYYFVYRPQQRYHREHAHIQEMYDALPLVLTGSTPSSPSPSYPMDENQPVSLSEDDALAIAISQSIEEIDTSNNLSYNNMK